MNLNPSNGYGGNNIRGKIFQVYPPKNLLSPNLLKHHQIVVLVDLFKLCKGSSPSIMGCQDTGARIFADLPRPLTFNCT